MSAINQALESVERGGTVLFFAPTEPGVSIPLSINDLFWRNEITLTSTRCSRFEVQPFPPQLMTSFIQKVLDNERMENYPPEPVAEIVKAAEGCPRQALVILDQIIDLPDFNSVMAAIESYTIEEAAIIELCRSLLNNNWVNCAKQLNALPEKADVEKIRYAVLSYMRKVLLGNKPDGQAARVIQAFRLPFYDSGQAGLVLASYLAVTRMNLDMPY